MNFDGRQSATELIYYAVEIMVYYAFIVVLIATNFSEEKNGTDKTL